MKKEEVIKEVMQICGIRKNQAEESFVAEVDNELTVALRLKKGDMIIAKPRADVFLSTPAMALTWHQLGKIFKIKGKKFEKPILKKGQQASDLV